MSSSNPGSSTDYSFENGAEEKVVAASPGQQGLWWLDSTLAQPESYNVPVLVKVGTLLDTATLELAVEQLSQLHEIFRTRFIFTGQRLNQHIGKRSQIRFTHQLLPDGVTPERIMNGLANTRISLEEGPLTFITLLTNTAGESWLACCFHHIIVDAPSVRIVLCELLSFYQQRVTNCPTNLGFSAASTEEFTCWQAGLLASAEAEQMRRYWHDLLSPTPQVTDLPVDYPRKNARPGKAGYTSVALSDIEARTIQSHAQKLGLTPFMYLTLCWQFFLHRITGQEDITVGIPFTLRDRSDFEHMPGYLINTLPLRTLIRGGETLRELASQIRERFIDAHVHKHLPFSEIAASSGGKVRQESPLFSTLLVMPDTRKDMFSHLPFQVTLNEYFSQAAKYDLTLFFETDSQWRLVLEYKTSLFHADTAAYWLTLFRQLLLSMAEQPEQTLDKQGLMDEAQQQALIIRASAPALPATPDVITLFNDYAAHHANSTALITRDGEDSYGWLAQRSNEIAAHLQRSFAIAPGKRVALLLERNAEAIAVLIGVLKTGAAYVPVDPQYPAERVKYMLQDAAVDCIVTTRNLAYGLNTEVPLICSEEIQPDDTLLLTPSVRAPEDELYIIYTSGSTGQPKGVRLLNRTLFNLIAWQRNLSCCGTGDVTLHYMSLSFDVSVQEIFGTLCSGGRLYIASEEERKDLHHLQQVILRQGIQRIYFPYVALQQFAHLSAMNNHLFPQLKEVYSTGEQLVLTADIKRFFSQPIRLINLYGPSESHVCSAWVLPENSAEWGDAASVGYPLPGFSMLVVDQHQRLVPAGVAGELLIVSDYLSPGYHNKEKETHQRFFAGEWPGAQSRQAYRSGDLVRLERGSNFSYLGRLDNQLKIRGFRIEPSEVEAAINALDGVQVSAVTGRDVAPGNRQLVAFIAGLSADKKASLQQQLCSQLPEYMVPGELVFLEKLPTTPSGKIDRKALLTIDIPRIPERPEIDEALSKTERQVKALWQQLLPSQAISVSDDFFAIGGHSLLATQLVYLLRQQFKADIPLKMLFNHPTLGGMAASVNRYLDEYQRGVIAMDQQFVVDGRVSLQWPILAKLPVARTGEILLTGASGFLGIYLLRALMQHSSQRVICLVRARTQSEAFNRLRENASRYGIVEEIDFSRIEVCCGDIAKPWLGLTTEIYNALSARVATVFHAAAQINFVLSYASVKGTNVEGILNILSFCADKSRKKLHYLSTIAVFSPRYPHQPINESAIPTFPDGLSIGYTQSKWVAEQYVQQAREAGLDISLYRIGRIAGDSRTGACQKDDFLWRQIKSFIQMGMAPDAASLATDLLPVDFVAQAITILSCQQHAGNHNYHLFHPVGTHFGPVYRAIQQLGYPLEIASDSVWLRQLETMVKQGKEVALGPVIHLFREEALDTGNNHYVNNATIEALRQADLTFPDINEDTFKRMIAYFHQCGELAVEKNY